MTIITGSIVVSKNVKQDQAFDGNSKRSKTNVSMKPTEPKARKTV
ncbi:hypothetical protein [Mucilaginibacter mallensis]|nr:hypothetical protein [Mucilaginibacter mallensis]